MSNVTLTITMEDAVLDMLQQVRFITCEGMVYTATPTAGSSLFQTYVVRHLPFPHTCEFMTSRVGANII